VAVTGSPSSLPMRTTGEMGISPKNGIESRSAAARAPPCPKISVRSPQ
jgi:hypothetical protein